MRTLVLMMLRQPVAQCLTKKLSGASGVRVLHYSDYSNAAGAVHTDGADTVLVEIAESGEYDASYCLALCSRLRGAAPGCRLLALCPEHDGAGVLAMVEAKQEGLIEDFIFYDASIDYMASKLLA